MALALSTMGDDGPQIDRAAALGLYENMVHHLNAAITLMCTTYECHQVAGVMFFFIDLATSSYYRYILDEYICLVFLFRFFNYHCLPFI